MKRIEAWTEGGKSERGVGIANPFIEKSNPGWAIEISPNQRKERSPCFQKIRQLSL